MEETRTTSSISVAKGYSAYVRRKRVAIAALIGVCFVVAVVALMVGAVSLSPFDVVAGVFGLSDAQTTTVVQNLRLPRVATGFSAGVALALSGCVFQAALRNPLASASTLGVSQGAAFGASIAIIVLGSAFGFSSENTAYEGTSVGNPVITALCAFIGAMLSTGVVLALSRFAEMTPQAIVLLGVALGAMFSGATALVQYFADDSQVAAVVFWTFGDLGRVTHVQLLLMIVVMCASAVFFFLNRWNYNAIEGGEALAHGIGVSVPVIRLLSLVVASACAATVIAFCGVISFVGLVAPHIMRRMLGADYRYLLPSSALAGAILLMLADIFCHVVAPPAILPIGALTSFVGGPLFVWLLFRRCA